MNHKTYTFEQLSQSAQAKALEVCRDINTSDDFWHESHTAHTLKPFLELLGFEDINIYFNLGYSQGDYAQIDSARFHYNKGFKKKLKDEFPQWTKAHELADQLQDICKRYFYGYSFSLRSGKTTDFEHKTWGNAWDFDIAPFENDIDDFMESINHMLYTSYRDEYEALTSDECVKEYLYNEDHLFFEDGTDSQTIFANAA